MFNYDNHEKHNSTYVPSTSFLPVLSVTIKRLEIHVDM